MKKKFPSKTTTDDLEDEIKYCQKLIEVIEKEDIISNIQKLKKN